MSIVLVAVGSRRVPKLRSVARRSKLWVRCCRSLKPARDSMSSAWTCRAAWGTRRWVAPR